jgi:hypothetical protein
MERVMPWLENIDQSSPSPILKPSSTIENKLKLNTKDEMEVPVPQTQNHDVYT